jgi:hypothetical protein
MLVKNEQLQLQLIWLEEGLILNWVKVLLILVVLLFLELKNMKQEE